MQAIECFDSLICPNNNALFVQERIAKLRLLIANHLEMNSRVLARAMALSSSFVALCGALAERPVECFEDLLLNASLSAT